MVATTSGTVGQTSIDVTTLIEHAVRRCGKLPSTLSSELQLAARESLFFLLSDLANDGLSLWCIGTGILPITAGQSIYTLPPGTVDVLNANFRTLSTLTPTATVSSTASVQSQFSVVTSPTNVQATFLASGISMALVIESSQDGLIWVNQGLVDWNNNTVSANQRIAQDIPNPIPSLYWRLRAGSGLLPTGTVLTWSNTPSEIPMAPLNRDDYSNLPNKTFQAARSLQYWFEKLIVPQVRLWPVPSVSTNQLVVQTHRQIQDIGAFTNALEVPQRWLESIIFTHACRIAVELPKGEIEDWRLTYLEGKASEHLSRAADGENDGAPFTLQPNIRGYTR